MKIELNLYDECVDAIVAKALQNTLRITSEDGFREMAPDWEGIAGACRYMLDYYGFPREET